MGLGPGRFRSAAAAAAAVLARWSARASQPGPATHPPAAAGAARHATCPLQVFSKQEDYPTAYFSMLGTGEFVNTPEGGACDGALGCKGDGEWLPGGWQPDASCVVQVSGGGPERGGVGDWWAGARQCSLPPAGSSSLEAFRASAHSSPRPPTHPPPSRTRRCSSPQPGSRSCSFTLHHTPDLQFLVTARDVWVANPAIKAQLRSPNNEKCLTEPGRKCVVASPRFFFGLKVTEHKCRRAGQLDGQTAVRCSGSFPMAQPGMLMVRGRGIRVASDRALAAGELSGRLRACLPRPAAVPSRVPARGPASLALAIRPPAVLPPVPPVPQYPGDNPKSYRETGFELEGVAYVHWELRSRVPLLVMLAPHEVAFNACPLGTPCARLAGRLAGWGVWLAGWGVQCVPLAPACWRRPTRPLPPARPHLCASPSPPFCFLPVFTAIIARVSSRPQSATTQRCWPRPTKWGSATAATAAGTSLSPVTASELELCAVCSAGRFQRCVRLCARQAALLAGLGIGNGSGSAALPAFLSLAACLLLPTTSPALPRTRSRWLGLHADHAPADRCLHPSPLCRSDVLLIAYPKFRTTPVPNPAETPPTIVDFRLTGWKR